MEDGSNGILLEVEAPSHVQNGVVSPIMANFPPEENTVASTNEDYTKVNGEASGAKGDYSSESDALVIDESDHKHRAKTSSEVVPHFNPYFGESLFELSQQHHHHHHHHKAVNPQVQKHKKPTKKNSPKLREYAQYLGLQPTVQFKCSRCGRAGFESLTTLNQHIVQCIDEPLTQAQVPQNSSSTSSFKLTRKVFLCSACGTYYENWNLFLHMVEVHKRHLCLYCLGMFSVLDDLCTHIQTRHNFEPGCKDSIQEFYEAYNEPCYVVCCECGKLFSEQDNFFYHTCAKPLQKGAVKPQKVNNKSIKPSKQLIRPEDHVTGDSAFVLAKEDSGDENLITQETNSGDAADLEENEIVYSTDSEANFKGFDDTGNAVYATKMMDQSDDIEESAPELEQQPIVETRKVPKLSLKLKPGSFPEIEHHSLEEIVENDVSMTEDQNNDADEVEQLLDSEEEPNDILNNAIEEETPMVEEQQPVEIQVAGADVHVVELKLEQPLDKFDLRTLLQRCLNATAPFCIYCNHARRIAVDGKQLGLHAIAQHRYSAVVSSITAEELIPESFVSRIKESVDELEGTYFSLESTASEDAVTFSHVFECFQCHYATGVHKELYLHNRKMHAKNLLLCIMCKSSFYNYSELICHLCPGQYVLDHDVEFRCCMCVSDALPSAFRLMVHLRKRHHVCDVCLEVCNSQYRLSNHVWKHKLHHFCYRCGIAYRNKPDITRHLFWKHGTESVLCKKCLQKKWPHVYHFCVPPASFTCEECNLSFSRAVALKVHKRIHTEEKPYACTVDDCNESFISKKLLAKHEQKHREPPKEEKPPEVVNEFEKDVSTVENAELPNETAENAEEKKPVVKPKIDVYDLPELNLSESDSSESEDETQKLTVPHPLAMQQQDGENETEETQQIIVENADIFAGVPDTTTADISTTSTDLICIDDVVCEAEENKNVENALIATAPAECTSSEVVLEDIWDNFKNYQANKEKFDHLFSTGDNEEGEANVEEMTAEEESAMSSELALRDHDYCYDPNNKQKDVSFIEVKPELSQSIDHDYCSSSKNEKETENPDKAAGEGVKEQQQQHDQSKSAKQRSSSSSSGSGSDTSSCSCGSNCSCSSASSSSSSTSDSSDSDSSTAEGRKRQQARRDRRRQKSTKNKTGAPPNEHGGEQKNVVDVVVDNQLPPVLIDVPIEESDLETTESETDEEFYDKQPQKLAKKILEEKRNLLLAGMEMAPNGSLLENSRAATPNLLEETAPVRTKKKSKSKKKKKKKAAAELQRRLDENREYESTSTVAASSVPYYKQYYPVPTPTVPPLTLNLPRSSGGVPSPLAMANVHSHLQSVSDISHDDGDGSLRPKRRRVPNKFYGYSSDEDDDKAAPPPVKWRKTEALPPPSFHASQMVVPPITLKTTSSPAVHQFHQQAKVQPFSIRTSSSQPGQMKVHHYHPNQHQKRIPPIRLKHSKIQQLVAQEPEPVESDEVESNDSSNEGRNLSNVNPDALYCYCKCPYDEVSEMIGCDASDCAIEWFHFECVGIMVPPKGHWYCPECRKKRQQKRELLKMKAKQSMMT